jgi:hypothetical protein
VVLPNKNEQNFSNRSTKKQVKSNIPEIISIEDFVQDIAGVTP